MNWSEEDTSMENWRKERREERRKSRGYEVIVVGRLPDNIHDQMDVWDHGA